MRIRWRECLVYWESWIIFAAKAEGLPKFFIAIAILCDLENPRIFLMEHAKVDCRSCFGVGAVYQCSKALRGCL